MSRILLEPRDYYIASGGVLVAIVAGFVVGAVPEKAPVIDLATNFVPSLVMVIGLGFIFLGRRHYGGQIARALEVVGIATAILMISWIPHFIWHVLGMPSLFAIGSSFWLAFFHVLTAGAFFVYFYGFYLFYKAGKPDVETPTTGPGADVVESGE